MIDHNGIDSDEIAVPLKFMPPVKPSEDRNAEFGQNTTASMPVEKKAPIVLLKYPEWNPVTRKWQIRRDTARRIASFDKDTPFTFAVKPGEGGHAPKPKPERNGPEEWFRCVVLES